MLILTGPTRMVLFFMFRKWACITELTFLKLSEVEVVRRNKQGTYSEESNFQNNGLCNLLNSQATRASIRCRRSALVILATSKSGGASGANANLLQKNSLAKWSLSPSRCATQEERKRATHVRSNKLNAG
jgi:hypothetical protein